MIDFITSAGRLFWRFLKSLPHLVWLSALLFSSLLFWRFWPPQLVRLMPALQAVTPIDVFSTTIGRAYIIVSLAIFLLFGLFARRRLVVTANLAAVLIIFQLVTSAYGWDRIGLMFTLLAGLCVAVEFFRQNADVVRELNKKKLQFGQVLAKSLKLWCPMLLVGAFGYVFHTWLTHQLEQLVYRTTPIDEYCDVSVSPSASISAINEQVPCREMHGEIAEAAIKNLSFEADAVSHVHQRYLEIQKTLLSHVVVNQDNRLSTDVPLATIASDLKAMLTPALALNLPAITLTLEERVAADPQIANLRTQVANLRPAWVSLSWVHILVQPTAQQQQLQRQIDQRAIQVRAEIEAGPKGPRPVPAEQLIQGLARRLSKLPELAVAPVPATASSVDQTSSIAHFVGEMIKIIAALSGSVEMVVAEEVKTWDSGHARDDIDAAFRSLGWQRLCSLSKPSRRLFTDDSYNTAQDVNVEPIPCWDAKGRVVAAQSMGLKYSADRSIAFWKETQIAAIETDTRGAIKSDLSGRDASLGAANALMAQVPSRIHLGREYCSAWPGNWGNCAANYAKSEAEHAYSGGRANAAEKYSSTVNSGAYSAETSVEQVILVTHANARELLTYSAQLLQVAVDTSIQYLRILDTVVVLFIVVALANSFLYVFAVVAFDKTQRGTIRIPGEARKAQGAFRVVTPQDKRSTVTLKPQERLVTKVLLNNQARQFTLAPWPLSAVLGRILHGKYFGYNRGGRISGAKEIVLSAKNKYIVDWKLSKGEEVVFRYGSFFGASENVELHTTISLSLATLLLERVIFHSAYCKEGGGHLLLITDTLEVGAHETNAIDAMPADRLLAFNRQVEFTAHSDLTMRSVLIDGHIVRRIQEGSQRGLVLVSSPEKSFSLWRGPLRFVRRMISPY